MHRHTERRGGAPERGHAPSLVGRAAPESPPTACLGPPTKPPCKPALSRLICPQRSIACIYTAHPSRQTQFVNIYHDLIPLRDTPPSRKQGGDDRANCPDNRRANSPARLLPSDAIRRHGYEVFVRLYRFQDIRHHAHLLAIHANWRWGYNPRAARAIVFPCNSRMAQ